MDKATSKDASHNGASNIHENDSYIYKFRNKLVIHQEIPTRNSNIGHRFFVFVASANLWVGHQEMKPNLASVPQP